MKLYTVVGSPNCRKVLAAVYQLGIAVDVEHLDYFYQRISALPAWMSSAPASPEAVGRRPAA